MNSVLILIVDDHPITVDGYLNLLAEFDFGDTQPQFIKANNCEQAFNIINVHKANFELIDLALLDISIPAFAESNIMDGVDVGSYLRKMMPRCKIIMQTMHSEPFRVDRIIKQLNPEGFVSKNDITYEIFPIVCDHVISGKTYYSSTINKARNDFSLNNLVFDVHDSMILTLLSQGIKTINLPEYIPLSLSAIEKRKATIKDQVLLQKGSDLELLQKARKLGLI